MADIRVFAPLSHLMGDKFDFAAGFAAASASRKTTVTTNAELRDAIANGINSNDLDWVAISDLGNINEFSTFQLYDAGGVNASLTAARTVDNQAFIGALNPPTFDIETWTMTRGVKIGTSDANQNANVQVMFGATASYITLANLYFNACYRSTTEGRTIRATNGANHNRLTGCHHRKGGLSSASSRYIDVLWASDHNRIDHNIFRAFDNSISAKVPVAITSWDGSLLVTAITRSGSTLTVTYFTYGETPLAVGEVVLILGVTQSDYNVAAGTVLTATGTGNLRTITLAITSSQATTGTFASELNHGLIKRVTHRASQYTRIDYNSFVDCFTNNSNGLLIQNGNTRVQGTGCIEEGYTTHERNWHQNCTCWQYSNDKLGGTTIRDIAGISNGASISLRDGNAKAVERIMTPFSGFEPRSGANHQMSDIICSRYDDTAVGQYDGTNNGAAAYDNEFDAKSGCVVKRLTVLGNMVIGRSEGYGGLVSDTPATNMDYFDYIVQPKSGAAVDYGSLSNPTYVTANNHVHDGVHKDLTNGTAGYDGSNVSTGAANFRGLFAPTSASPTAIKTGAQQDYTGEFGIEGEPDPVSLGGKPFVADDPIFQADFTGSANALVTGLTPTTNDTGSSVISATQSLTVNGSGVAISTANFASNGVNLASVEQRNVIDFKFGGNNRVRVWCRTNSSLTAGFYAEIDKGSNLIRLFRYTGALIWKYPLGLFSLNDTTTYRLEIIAKGDNIWIRFHDQTMPGITETGNTGTFVFIQSGVQANSGLQITGWLAESDATAVEVPVTPTVVFHYTADGSANTAIPSTALSVGASLTLSAQTTADQMKSDGSGRFRSNGNELNVYTLYQASIDTGLADNSDEFIFEFDVPNFDHNSSSDRVIFGVIGRWQDANNFIAAEVVWASAQSNRAVNIYQKVSGSLTQLKNITNVALADGDNIKFKVTRESGGSTSRLEVLQNDILVNATGGDALVTGFDAVDSPGDYYFYNGQYLTSGGDTNFNTRYDNVKITVYTTDTEIDPTAPVPDEAPNVIEASETSIIIQGTPDIAAKFYAAAHIEGSNYTLDPAGVQHIIDEESPSGSSLTTVASDTSVSANEQVQLTIDSLDGLTVSGKAAPFIKIGATFAASDDTQMSAPYIISYDLPAPGQDSATFDPQNPAPGEYYRRKYDDVSLLDANGYVAQTWTLTNGSYVEVPYFDDSGTYRVSIDPITGVMTFDSEGNAATISGLNAWVVGQTDWEEGSAGATLDIEADSPALPVFTTSIPNVAGSDLVNTTLQCTHIPKSLLGNLAPGTTNATGNLNIQVPAQSGDLIIMEDLSATPPDLFVERVP